jgi:hypothetical protein
MQSAEYGVQGCAVLFVLLVFLLNFVLWIGIQAQAQAQALALALSQTSLLPIGLFSS